MRQGDLDRLPAPRGRAGPAPGRCHRDHGGRAGDLAAMQATTTIPIVMRSGDSGGDGPRRQPRAARRERHGAVLTRRRPRGETLELLKEAVPGLARVAVLWHPPAPATSRTGEAQAAAPALGLRCSPMEVRDPEEFDDEFATMPRLGRRRALSCRGPIHARRIKDASLNFAATHRLPTVCGAGIWPRRGASSPMAPAVASISTRAATYVDKILKGTKPPISRWNSP